MLVTSWIESGSLCLTALGFSASIDNPLLNSQWLKASPQTLCKNVKANEDNPLIIKLVL